MIPVRARSRPRLAAAFPILAILAVLALSGCQDDGVGPDEYGTFSFTGFVIDGSTKIPLEGAVLSYSGRDGENREAVTDASGAFLVEALPFGERNFQVRMPASGSDPEYTRKLVVVSSLIESRSIEGVVGNVSMVVALYPLTGSVSGTLAARIPRTGRTAPANRVAVRLAFRDTAVANSSPVVFDTVTDSEGRFSFQGLPVAPGASLAFNPLTLEGNLYDLAPLEVDQMFSRGKVELGTLYMAAKDSTDRSIRQVRSNVLSADGFGLPSVPVDLTLWYALPIAPEEGTLAVTLSGGKVPDARLSVRGDTLFVDPVENLSFDTEMTVAVSGLDTAGNQIQFTFDGTRAFRTEKGIHPVESNAWERAGVPKEDFLPGDTLWMRFSALLDPDVNKVTWSAASADNDIFAGSVGANGLAWIKADTLFVRPDQRLALDHGETLGFKITVLSRAGKRSDTVEAAVRVAADKYYVKWTNTKDDLGRMREDFGPMDSVVVVSSSPIREILGLSPLAGRSAPPDLFLDNVKLRGDTLIYKPSLYLKTDSTYGLDFDLLFADGQFRRHAFPVDWKTMGSIQVLSVDNRLDGLYRPLKAIGDSFTVVFSVAIDTAAASSVPFRVNMTDVNGQPIRSRVRWSGDRRTAVIHNLDTLPTADFDASPAYTEDAVDTRAVGSITFDLITGKGEKVFRFKPANRNIQLHSERGFCLVDANILAGHDRRSAVGRTETPVADFAVDGSVTLAFNREIDTAAIRADTVNQYFQIRTVTDTIRTTLSFSADAKTATLKPAANLAPGADYRVWIRNVPARGIAGAAPINNHGGTFSGSAINNSLLDAVFRTKK